MMRGGSSGGEGHGTHLVRHSAPRLPSGRKPLPSIGFGSHRTRWARAAAGTVRRGWASCLPHVRAPIPSAKPLDGWTRPRPFRRAALISPSTWNITQLRLERNANTRTCLGRGDGHRPRVEQCPGDDDPSRGEAGAIEIAATTSHCPPPRTPSRAGFVSRGAASLSAGCGRRSAAGDDDPSRGRRAPVPASAMSAEADSVKL